MCGLSMLITPPADTSRDAEMVKSFLKRPGKKVVCGGSSSRMVEAFLGAETEIDLSVYPEILSPAGYLPGIDLVTEGSFVLERTLRNLTCPTYTSDPQAGSGDGAGILTSMILDAGSVEIFRGSAKGLFLSDGIPEKKRVMKDLTTVLKNMGKKITVHTY